MLSDELANDGKDAKPSAGTGIQVQLPEHTYRHLAQHFQLVGGS